MKKQNQNQAKTLKSQQALLAQMNSVLNQVKQAAGRQPSTLPANKRKKSKKLRSNGQQAGMEGNARLIRSPTIGMPDLQAHRVSWVCGSVYVGNGTLGAADGVYFADGLNGAYVVPGLIPILGADSRIGASYVKAIEQLYRRKRYLSLKVKFQAIQSSTTNNMTLTAAPIRGAPSLNETGVGTTGTTAALTQQNVMSMTGSKTVDSFENLELDLTPYIAGGSSAKQNEFAIGDQSDSQTNASMVSTAMDLLAIAPACFALAGNSTVSALRGTKTHLIVVETVCDYLDFVGGVPQLDVPAAEKCASCAEKAKLLKANPTGNGKWVVL